MWTDGWMGRQFLIKQHRSCCLGQSWRIGWRVGRVAESCHRPGSQGPAASTHHICSRVYTRHQEERERPAKACFARTALGKTVKVTSLGPPLSSLWSWNFCLVKMLGDPLCPHHFRFTGPEKGGGRIEKLEGELESCWRWNLGHKWDSVFLW